MKWFAAVAFIILLFALPALASPTEDFQEALKLYDQGKFTESADKFQGLISTGYSSPQLFYDAGCAYFKAGKRGLAIANFRRAQRLAPEDEDVKANLDYCKLYLVDKIDAPQDDILQTKVVSYLANLSPNQYFLISFIAILAIFTLLALKRLGTLGSVGGAPIGILGFVAIVGIAAMIWVTRSNYLAEEGVITAAQTEILSGPGTDFELQFEGHEGLTFKILEKRDEYYLALFANKLKGWVKTSAIEEI